MVYSGLPPLSRGVGQGRRFSLENAPASGELRAIAAAAVTFGGNPSNSSEIAGIGFNARQAALRMVSPMPPEWWLATAGIPTVARSKKGSMMAGFRAPVRSVLCVLKTTAVAGMLSALCAGAAVAQAPIVYKNLPSGYSTPRLDNRADPLALNVAPRAPVPTFADEAAANAPLDLRPAAATRSFGPTPLAAASVGEPVALKASTSRSAIQPAMAVPYAGPPYQVNGRWYVPAHEPNYNEVGIASWYGPTFHGKDSASGEVFNENDLTAAHPTLPIPSLVRVTNLENGRTVIVRVNDRGPFVDDRIIDLSKAAGAALDMHAKGTVKVRVEYVGAAPLNGGGQVAAPAPAQTPERISLVSQPLPSVATPMASRPVVSGPVAAMPAPAAAGRFYVQAGSFADLANAHALRQKLASDGRVSIESAAVNGSEFYRVMIGPWASREEAASALSRSGAKGLVVARGR